MGRRKRRRQQKVNFGELARAIIEENRDAEHVALAREYLRNVRRRRVVRRAVTFGQDARGRGLPAARLARLRERLARLVRDRGALREAIALTVVREYDDDRRFICVVESQRLREVVERAAEEGRETLVVACRDGQVRFNTCPVHTVWSTGAGFAVVRRGDLEDLLLGPGPFYKFRFERDAWYGWDDALDIVKQRPGLRIDYPEAPAATEGTE